MKEFDLEAAKAGKAVCTRNGRPARIICWDKKSNDGQFPIVALIEDEDNIEEPQTYKVHGLFFGEGVEHGLDLMMVSEKKEGWVNVYREKDGSLGCSMIRSSKEEAVSHIIHKRIYVDTVKVEWEE